MSAFRKIDSLSEGDKADMVARLLKSGDAAVPIAEAYSSPHYTSQYVEQFRWANETASPTYAHAGLLGLVAGITGNSVSITEGSNPMSKVTKCTLWALAAAPSSCGKNQSFDTLVLDPISDLESETQKSFLWTHGSAESLIDTVKSAPLKSVLIYSTEATGLLRQIVDAVKYPTSPLSAHNLCDVYSNNRFNVKFRKATPVKVDDCRIHILGAIQPFRLVEYASLLQKQPGFLGRFLFICDDPYLPEEESPEKQLQFLRKFGGGDRLLKYAKMLHEKCLGEKLELRLSPEAEEYLKELKKQHRVIKNDDLRAGKDTDNQGKFEMLLSICAYEHIIECLLRTIRDQGATLAIERVVSLDCVLSAERKFRRSEAFKSELLQVTFDSCRNDLPTQIIENIAGNVNLNSKAADYSQRMATAILKFPGHVVRVSALKKQNNRADIRNRSRQSLIDEFLQATQRLKPFVAHVTVGGIDYAVKTPPEHINAETLARTWKLSANEYTKYYHATQNIISPATIAEVEEAFASLAAPANPDDGLNFGMVEDDASTADSQGGTMHQDIDHAATDAVDNLNVEVREGVEENITVTMIRVNPSGLAQGTESFAKQRETASGGLELAEEMDESARDQPVLSVSRIGEERGSSTVKGKNPSNDRKA